MIIPRARFEKCRAAVLAAGKARDEMRSALERKYGPAGQTVWFSAGDRAMLRRKEAAYELAAARMFTLLERSPRAWDRGIPAYWVAECLTYDDAVRPAGEPLSVEPPRAYGY